MRRKHTQPKRFARLAVDYVSSTRTSNRSIGQECDLREREERDAQLQHDRKRRQAEEAIAYRHAPRVRERVFHAIAGRPGEST